MKTERRIELLELLGRVPSSEVRCTFRPIAPLLREISATREELMSLIDGGAITCGEFAVQLERADQLRFERLPRLATPSGVPTIAASSMPAAFRAGPDCAFDPIEVGEAAREFADAERRAGRDISATDAVAHVLKHQRAHRQRTDGDSTAAQHAHVAAQLAEVFRRCANGKRI
jgi:hypothetical protein